MGCNNRLLARGVKLSIRVTNQGFSIVAEEGLSSKTCSRFNPLEVYQDPRDGRCVGMWSIMAGRVGEQQNDTHDSGKSFHGDFLNSIRRRPDVSRWQILYHPEPGLYLLIDRGSLFSNEFPTIFPAGRRNLLPRSFSSEGSLPICNVAETHR
jgi:hypothetical protein